MSQYNDQYAGGGGYIPGGGSPFSNSGTPGGANRRNEVSQSLRPVTVAQLVKASQPHTDADWTIDNTEIGQVTLVGQVVSVRTQATNIVYWIDDSTGRIEARHWLDTSIESESIKWTGIEENTYVRVVGNLKTFADVRYLNATHIRTSKDVHEVYFHSLEVITASLALERGAPPYAGQPSTAAPVPGASQYVTQAQTAQAQDEFAHHPPLPRAILGFMTSQPTSPQGIHVSAIARACSSLGDAAKISLALETLMDDGLIFSTIDDSHFQLSR
ncbi:hypothetical protein BD779DRAFT_1509479 [Infundibulicybe gibba]|nr:hypothetical protein BD779DRAFT_1509479 [Infundibulicybe gibba]